MTTNTSTRSETEDALYEPLEHLLDLARAGHTPAATPEQRHALAIVRAIIAHAGDLDRYAIDGAVELLDETFADPDQTRSEIASSIGL